MLGPIELLIILGVMFWGLPRLMPFFTSEARAARRRSLRSAFMIGISVGVAFLVAVVAARSGFLQSLADVEPRSVTQRDAIPSVTKLVNAEQPLVAEDPQQESLPDWVKRGMITVREGVVPTVLVVKKSGDWPTQDDARRDAIAAAKNELLSRMSSKYDGISSWDIPTELFSRLAKKNEHVQSRLHDFGNFKDSMYVGYIEFEDSPEVREQLAEQWERFSVNRKVKNVGGVLGAVVLGLGLLSVALRGGARLMARRHSPAAVSPTATGPFA